MFFVFTSDDYAVFTLEIEILLVAKNTVGVHLEHLESDSTLHFARQSSEQFLSSFVGRSRRSNLVDPVIFRIVVDKQLFDKAAKLLQYVSIRYF